jgi:hypothetical protein
MPSLLPCSCGQSTAVHKSQAGTYIRCPSCQQRLEVPTIAGFAALTPVADDSLQHEATLRRRSSWTPMRGFSAAVCFILALVGLGQATLYGVYRWANPTAFTVEGMLAEMDQTARSMPPAESWDLFHSIQEHGLGEKKPPAAFVKKRNLEILDRRMFWWASGGLLGFFGLLLTTWYRPRTPRPQKGEGGIHAPGERSQR